MTVKCLYCNTEQKKYYGLWYCPKCKTLPNHYKVMVNLAKKEVLENIINEIQRRQSGDILDLPTLIAYINGLRNKLGSHSKKIKK